MDKNEFMALIEKVNTLQAKGKTKAALDLLDAVNWRKVHNVNSLLKVAEIYENAGRPDDAMEILWMARDRSRVARAVISRLALLCIKMKEYDEAQEFLEEFIDVAPHDSQQFVIRYELAKAKGGDDATLIAILEELKNNDFLEDRGYELAILYKKVGQLDKCVDLCDEIILWFGEGPYVEKAMELKKTIGSLSQEQEELYRKLKHGGEDEIREISLPDDDMPQVTVNTDRFATVNLQEEIKKNIADIIGTSEEEAESVYKNDGLIHNIPYSQGLGDTKEIRIEKKEIEVATTEERRKTIEDAVRTMDAALRDTEEALAEMDTEAMEQTRENALAEAAGIIKRLGELQQVLETGRNEEEREKEEALRNAANQLRSMAKAIEGGSSEPIDYKKAGALVGEVNTLLQEKIARLTAEEETPKAAEEASDTVEAAEEAADTAEETPKAAEEAADTVEAADTAEETPAAAETESSAAESAEEASSDEVSEITYTQPIEPETESNSDTVEAAEDTVTESAEEAESEETTGDVEITDPQNSEAAEKIETEEAQEPDMSWAETPDQLAAEQAKKEAPKKEANADKAEKKKKTDPLQEAFEKRMTIAQWTTIFDAVPDDVFGTKYSAAVEGEQYTLTAEEKEVFDYMAPIDGMETKVGGALACAKRFYGDPRNTDGHIVISGNAGSGRTTLAMGLVQVLQKEIHKPRGPVGRINAQKLNDKDVVDVFRKVKSGVLIIEKAGSMHKSTVRALNMLMRTDRSNILVIIEDTREEIAKLLRNNKDFAERFGRQVDIPIFTNDELVNFARSYAKEKKCVIDEMAALALYNRINMIQRQGHATTLSDIQQVMDEAIASANKRGLFGGRKKDSEGRLVLREKNFAAK